MKRRVLIVFLTMLFGSGNAWVGAAPVSFTTSFTADYVEPTAAGVSGSFSSLDENGTILGTWSLRDDGGTVTTSKATNNEGFGYYASGAGNGLAGSFRSVNTVSDTSSGGALGKLAPYAVNADRTSDYIFTHPLSTSTGMLLRWTPAEEMTGDLQIVGDVLSSIVTNTPNKERDGIRFSITAMYEDNEKVELFSQVTDSDLSMLLDTSGGTNIYKINLENILFSAEGLSYIDFLINARNNLSGDLTCLNLSVLSSSPQSSVPEPASWLLLILGVGGLWVYRKKRNRV
ncbi:MAG: PEP-CTERM sorting domain-containing protein [Planctomycetia bacterium]|nr:PEP-CTERM sorting domain-containing protein [Planctomycetia bacterium]